MLLRGWHCGSPYLQYISCSHYHCWCTWGIINVLANRHGCGWTHMFHTHPHARSQFRAMGNVGKNSEGFTATQTAAEPNNWPHKRRVTKEKHCNTSGGMGDQAESEIRAWAGLLKPSSQVLQIGLIEPSAATFRDRWEKQSSLWMKSPGPSHTTDLFVYF